MADDMNSPEPAQACVKPWVEWFAKRIDDPVARLKFLRSVTPLAVSRARRRPFWQLGIAAVILLAILGSLLIVRASARVKTVAAATRPNAVHPPPAPTSPVSPIWLVDRSTDSETYSNGLRIDTRFETANHPRAYLAFPADRPDAGAGVRRTQPAGIVFHTTESRQLPFEASANGALKRIGESLIQFVRRKRAYHFLIDRFGRVYRIVSESDAAEHAGYSVWSDEDWLYLNLNESFLAISFEAQTDPGQEDPTVSPAQIRAAAMLTEMLRSRYRISANNCVTHAQVSVNPDNMRVGYHTDWASSFPFAQMGLPDNYARPLPSLTVFGFQYDATFVHWAGTRLYSGVELAEQELDRDAAASGMTTAHLQKMLRKRYRARLAEVARLNGGSEASEGAAR
jgi:N-acetylmuramoyl-L-alanine amidase